MAAMPQNDLGFIYLRAASVKQIAYNQQAELQKAQAVAGQGYKSVDTSKTTEKTTSSGSKVTVPSGSDYKGTQSITTPGSTVKSISEEVLKMPLSMLNYANTIPQVVTSMVNSMISQVIQQGVTKMTAPIDAQIVKARNQAGASLNQMQSAVQNGITSGTYFK
jgi:proline dehydrogenase